MLQIETNALPSIENYLRKYADWNKDLVFILYLLTCTTLKYGA